MSNGIIHFLQDGEVEVFQFKSWVGAWKESWDILMLEFFYFLFFSQLQTELQLSATSVGKVRWMWSSNLFAM